MEFSKVKADILRTCRDYKLSTDFVRFCQKLQPLSHHSVCHLSLSLLCPAVSLGFEQHNVIASLEWDRALFLYEGAAFIVCGTGKALLPGPKLR